MTQILKLAFRTSLTVLFAAVMCLALSGQAPVGPTARISGRVMIGDKPAADIPVIVFIVDTYQARAIAQTTTDAEGHYLLTKLPKGQVNVTTSAPSYSIADASTDVYGRFGKSVTLT